MENYLIKNLFINPDIKNSTFNSGLTKEELNLVLEEHFERLLIEIKEVQPEEAPEILKKGVRTAEKEWITNPKTADDFFLIAYSAQMDKNYDKALDYYQKTIALDPNDTASHNNMGNTYADGKQNYNKAIECFIKTIKINPDYEAAYYNMGRVLEEVMDYNKAIDFYRKIVYI